MRAIEEAARQASFSILTLDAKRGTPAEGLQPRLGGGWAMRHTCRGTLVRSPRCRSSRDEDQAAPGMKRMPKTHRYGVCVENRGNPAALEVRKIYRMLDDASAETQGLVRVIDESGEDYLYPVEFFVPIEVPSAAAKAFSKRSA